MIQPGLMGKGMVGKRLSITAFKAKVKRNTPRDADYRQKPRLPQYQIDDIKLRSTQRLQNPNLPRPLQNSRVHGLENDDEADHHRQADHHVQRIVESRKMLRRHQRERFGHRLYLVFRHPWMSMDLLHDQLLVFGIVAFHEDQRSIVFRS